MGYYNLCAKQRGRNQIIDLSKNKLCTKISQRNVHWNNLFDIILFSFIIQIITVIDVTILFTLDVSTDYYLHL